MISGITMLLLLLGLVPFYKHIRKIFESAASYVLWLVIFLFCFLLSKVISEITVISFIGFISNLFGAALMKISERFRA